MKIFLAGASGVLGVRLVPLLVDAGHAVVGMTRTPAKADARRHAGRRAGGVRRVRQADALTDAVVAARPDLVMHQLTDLPDNPDRLPDIGARNVRMRTEGTDNLLAAMRAAGTRRILAQSIAWNRGAPASATAANTSRRRCSTSDGVVLRYGQFYGPVPITPDALPDDPRGQFYRLLLTPRSITSTCPPASTPSPTSRDRRGRARTARARVRADGSRSRSVLASPDEPGICRSRRSRSILVAADRNRVP